MTEVGGISIKNEDIHIISGKVLMENGIGLIKKGM